MNDSVEKNELLQDIMDASNLGPTVYKEFIDQITHITPDLITIHDEHDIIVYCNRADYFDGWSAADLRNLSAQQWTEAMVHEDDREAVEAYIAIRKLLKDGEVTELEYRVKDGRWWRSRSKVFRRNEQGNCTHIITYTQDVTEQKRSEERMRATLESATDFAIITMDTDRKVLSWNIGAEHIFGYSEAEMLGHTADEIFTPEDREAGAPQKEQAQADREGRAFDERWHKRKDDSRVFMSGVMVPMRSNILPGYVKIARDITDRKLQEQQKDEFIGIASHELKTPVTSMKAYAEIVMERLMEVGNTEDSDLLLRLNVQIDRLTKLINDLLDTTRISEGKLQLTFEQVDINELLKERIDEIKYTTTQTLELKTQPLPSLYADRERIGQVITNLLANAIKYSPKEKTITITATYTPNEIQVSVSDQGYGIPEADQQKIFDRYFRVTANKMNTFPGMGLGLYISAQIIQRHGGTISVQSREGEGSTFSFTIPIENGT